MTPTQISVMISILSLVFGFASWVMGVLAITARKACSVNRNSAFSFGFCIIPLVLQLFEIQVRVNIGDYAAIEDTIKAVLIASVTLVVVTVALNVAALLKAKK